MRRPVIVAKNRFFVDRVSIEVVNVDSLGSPLPFKRFDRLFVACMSSLYSRIEDTLH